MSEDRTIVEAVSRIKIDHPSMEIGLALAIGEAILAERQRCADVANGWAMDEIQHGETRLAAAYIRREILNPK